MSTFLISFSVIGFAVKHYGDAASFMITLGILVIVVVTTEITCAASLTVLTN